MLGAEVLDTATYPVISFSSQSVRKTGDNRWRVTGELTLHGQTHPVSVEVTRAGDNFRGSAAVLQHEFGIKPVSVAGGAGKVPAAGIRTGSVGGGANTSAGDGGGRSRSRRALVRAMPWRTASISRA